MASLSLTFTGLDGITDLGVGSTAGKDQLQRVVNLLRGIENGAQDCSGFSVNASATNAVAASSDVTATTSGALGVVVNGTTVTQAFSVSQDGTATAAVAAINANTTVNKLVVASKGVTGHLTVTAVLPGALGNACTLTVTGTGAAATGAGKLTGGTGVDSAPVSFIP